tara:strand:- start:2890 stop:3357 length:468 start_codon:yes stop_codon:yes gene_type:complete
MATFRLIHVVRDGSGDTTGLAEYTNADTVLLPVHSSDPSESNEGAMIYNSTANTIKIYTGSAWETVASDATALLDGDSDFTLSDGIANGIHYELDNTDMANWNAGGIQLLTAGGIFRHNQTQAATYTIASGEGAVMAGPVTVTGTITNQGTLVIM